MMKTYFFPYRMIVGCVCVSFSLLVTHLQPHPVQAIVDTVTYNASSASLSGALTTAANQPVRPAYGPVKLQYKSGNDAWSDGLIIREIDGNVGIGGQPKIGPSNSKIAVAGIVESLSGGLKFPNSTVQSALSLPSGTITYYNDTACPTGWSPLDGLGGRRDARGVTIVGLLSGGTMGGIVGSALTSLENRTHTHTGPSHSHTYTDVVSHTHSIDPPATTSGAPSVTHIHSVDPASTTSDTQGSHSHTFGYRNDNFTQGASAYGTDSSGTATANTQGSGAHTHTLDVASFASGTNSVSHTHSTDVASFTSGSTGVATGTSATSGTGSTSTAATGDVIPYIQLLPCKKN